MADEPSGPVPTGSLQGLLVATRRFLERDVDALAHDRKAKLTEAARSGARSLGLYGLAIPPRFGGLGLSLRECATVVGEVARVDRSLAVTLALHAGPGTHPLLELADRRVQDRWLPLLARGERSAAFAATEPGRPELASTRTRLRREGDALCVTGEKAPVPNATRSGVLLVLAHDERSPARPSTLVIVPSDADGVRVRAEPRTMGLRATTNATVWLDGARVPADHGLGARGLSAAHRAVAWGRVLLSAASFGATCAVLDRALDLAADGRGPGLELGAVRHPLAAIAAARTTIGRLLERAAAHEDDLSTHAGALKVLADELTNEACDRALSIFGSRGIIDDDELALLARDCRVARTLEGADDLLLVRHGTGVLAGHGLAGSVSELGGPLAEEIVMLREHLSGAVLSARRTHGVGAIRRQTLLKALAWADLWLLAAASTAGRASEPIDIYATRIALDRAARALDRAEHSERTDAHEDDVLEALLARR